MENIEKMIEENLGELVLALDNWEERVKTRNEGRARRRKEQGMKTRNKDPKMRADEIASIRKTIVDFVHEQSTILKIVYNFKVDTEERRQIMKSEYVHNFKTILRELRHSSV
ncbi:MAG: hypothetical protein WC467_03990 [Patescibacteria group bacterium]